MPEKSKLRLDDFIAKVVNDPSQPQDTLLLQGFLGVSSEPDHTRVYADVTLDSYVDVANADIVHSEPLPKDQSPLGGAYIWVKKDAEVYPTPAATPGAARAKAKFLEGPIAAEASGVTAGAVPAVLPKTAAILACHPTIVVRACLPQTRPWICHPSVFCPTKPIVCVAATGSAACEIPDPTIYQQTPQQFQAHAQVQQGPGAPAMEAAALYPSAYCSAFCPRTSQFNCHPQTPNCPQIVHQAGAAEMGGAAQAQFATAAGCNIPIAHSVLYTCPSVPAWHCYTQPAICQHTAFIHCPRPTIWPPCPVQTAACPIGGASAACGVPEPGGFAQAAQFGAGAPIAALPVSQLVAHCPVTVGACPSIAVAACVSVAGAVCPTPACPTPQHHCPSVGGYQCPSVGGYQCPSVQGYQCPSVAGFQCPSVHHYQCPSVNNYQCPHTAACTDIGPGCMFTPNPVHCPTPNMMCPRPTSNCPSQLEICPTSSPLFCS